MTSHTYHATGICICVRIVLGEIWGTGFIFGRNTRHTAASWQSEHQNGCLFYKGAIEYVFFAVIYLVSMFV